MKRYVCIHGHFYQPPRENPWLEAIELEDSAYPYHDWNVRITAECYAPNARSRILDAEGRIARIVNNYARISFNMGPTLLGWMERSAPATYAAILEADRDSQARFSGHGSAIAQVYNHIIMPLASSRDKRSEVVWGVRDFERRFGRGPEGMWLAETAVDLESLELLAEVGVRFTILAPHQVSRVRRLGAGAWKDVGGGRIDPSRAYLLNLPSGRKLNLFVYDGPIARAVAFEGLLGDGERFARRILDGFSEGRRWPQLVHIATDGESYGHHHNRGDMALAYALHSIEEGGLAQLTNYGEFLDLHPPTHEVEILEDTAWSCAHGVGRWRSDCGCSSGGHGDWSQAWRAPLRAALDWLRDELAGVYERASAGLLRDPWAARDDYIDVVLDRSPDSVDRFLARHAVRTLDRPERIATLKLLEMQRHALLMYTSCGWFFDEISGIETVQIIKYAGRALQLSHELEPGTLEDGFRERLAAAPSNLPEHKDGREIYDKWVRPAVVSLERVGAHYALTAIFDDPGDHARVYCHSVERLDGRLLQVGRTRLSLGRARICSEITGEVEELSFGVLHLGDHNLTGGVRRFRGEEEYAAMVEELTDTFGRGDLPHLMRAVDGHFPTGTYSLKLLFRDEQRRIIARVLDSTLQQAGSIYRQIYEQHAALMRFLADAGAPVPDAIRMAAEFALNTNLRSELEADLPDLARVEGLLDEARGAGVRLDDTSLEFSVRRTLERLAARLAEAPADVGPLQRLDALLDLAGRALPFAVNLWQVQNLYHDLMEGAQPEEQARATLGDRDAQAWIDRFRAVGDKLRIRLPEARPVHDGGVLQDALARARVPSSTYRLQFSRAFTFWDAAALVPYLHDLGVSDCYASPIFKSQPESSHGYDVSDHGELSPELGGPAGFEALVAALRERGMGLILDVVPNHMGISGSVNAWWTDVLENGRSSPFACYFDIDWHPATPELSEKVLLPILADQYGRVLESGELRLSYDGSAFFLHYFDHRLPVAPRSYRLILERAASAAGAALGEDSEQVQELRSVLTAISYLPERSDVDPGRVAERYREKEIVKRRVTALCEASEVVRQAVDEAVRAFNGTAGEPRSFDLLDDLLAAQAYRLADWRVAAEEINYRRFFDVNELAAIRVEVPEVFAATHALVLRLLKEGQATGLRIDHADGLWDPKSYLRQLQSSYLLGQLHRRLAEQGSDPPAETRAGLERELLERFAQHLAQPAAARPLYVVVEKILAEGEALAEDWPVAGTTGYDFLNSVNGLFIDGRSRGALDALYHEFTGSDVSYEGLVSRSKKMIMRVSLSSELNALSHKLERISERNRRYRDFTLNGIGFALREVIACLPIYRTYITASGPVGPSGEVSARDRDYLESATADAKRRNPRTAESIFDFIRDTLLLRNLADFSEPDRAELVEFAMKFQQISGPVMAKGVEDTAFYIYNRLVSLNEVGGHPGRFGLSPEDFHAESAARQAHWPGTMLTLSTHDTKRSADVRARIDVLSEIPEEWRAAVLRLAELSARHKVTVDGAPAPDRNDEYLLYQTLVGAWPEGPLTGEALGAFRERMVAYMLKATKEAKVRTSWISPNEAYDAAVRGFVQAVLPDGEGEENDFRRELLRLQRRVAHFGRFGALSQWLLLLTSPGVPDLYQGSELWTLQLVDPDNRGTVDYEARKAQLQGLRERAEAAGADLGALAGELLGSIEDGRAKLYLAWRMLGLRRERAALFHRGAYVPLEVRGRGREHAVAFARVLGDDWIVAVAPRLMVGLTGGADRPPLGEEVWQDTWLVLPDELAGARVRDRFTGAVLPIGVRDGARGLPAAAVLGRFPVAVLEVAER